MLEITRIFFNFFFLRSSTQTTIFFAIACEIIVKYKNINEINNEINDENIIKDVINVAINVANKTKKIIEIIMIKALN